MLEEAASYLLVIFYLSGKISFGFLRIAETGLHGHIIIMYIFKYISVLYLMIAHQMYLGVLNNMVRFAHSVVTNYHQLEFRFFLVWISKCYPDTGLCYLCKFSISFLSLVYGCPNKHLQLSSS